MPHTLLLADDSVTIQRVIELTFADEDIRVVVHDCEADESDDQTILDQSLALFMRGGAAPAALK